MRRRVVLARRARERKNLDKEASVATGQYPTVRRRRLASELKRLRGEAGLTGEQVAERLADLGGRWSPTKISRIETGRVSVHHGDVADLLDLYGLTDASARGELIAIARESGRKGWWHSYSDVTPQRISGYLDFEAAARAIRIFQGDVLPGLLQTEEYAHAVVASVLHDSPQEKIQRIVELRMGRQQILSRPDPLQLWAILDEAALRRAVGGPAVMRAQLEHLTRAAELPNVTIQVIPYAAGEHPGMDSPFTILEFPDQADPDVVYLEHLLTTVYLEEADEVRRYSLFFDHLRAVALSPHDSIRMIATAVGEH
jgi:transcriptional regulator with XRE-family HTH domain